MGSLSRPAQVQKKQAALSAQAFPEEDDDDFFGGGGGGGGDPDREISRSGFGAEEGNSDSMLPPHLRRRFQQQSAGAGSQYL